MSNKPVTIMLDGMSDEPIAIPFPFEIGEFVIRNPDDWHGFKRVNADLQVTNDRRLDLLRDIEHEFENCGKCLMCQGQLNVLTEKIDHDAYCEHAKELLSQV